MDKRDQTNEDGINPVLGVIMIVAVTVILAAIITAFVLGLGDQATVVPQQNTETVSYYLDAQPTTVVGNETVEFTLQITNTGDNSKHIRLHLFPSFARHQSEPITHQTKIAPNSSKSISIPVVAIDVDERTKFQPFAKLYVNNSVDPLRTSQKITVEPNTPSSTSKYGFLVLTLISSAILLVGSILDYHYDRVDNIGKMIKVIFASFMSSIGLTGFLWPHFAFINNGSNPVLVFILTLGILMASLLIHGMKDR